MAPKKTSKTQPAGDSSARRTSLAGAATFIGASLGELMNRKDALAKQLANVEKQIAAARDRVTATVTSAVGARKTTAAPSPAKKTAKPAAPAGRKGNRKKKRPLPADDPGVKSRTRAAQADAKGRASERLKTSMRSGNR